MLTCVHSTVHKILYFTAEVFKPERAIESQWPSHQQKKLWASIFKPTIFYRLFSQINFSMVRCNFTTQFLNILCLHHFYFCSLVNYNEIFSLYFECTLSTKISHPQDKNKWHQLVSKKLTLHEICQVQCSHLPTNENLFQRRSFRNVDMPPKR